MAAITVQEMRHRGGCLCGSVRYEVAGPPVALTLCYCRFCQRATGSSHMVEPIWAESDFALTAGTPSAFSIPSQGSGKLITILFCGDCGTKLCQRMERFPGVVGLYGGTLDQPEIAALADETWRMFLKDAVPGTIIPPGVKVWREHRFDASGKVQEPIVFEAPHIV